jgi:hypothetical protein
MHAQLAQIAVLCCGCLIHASQPLPLNKSYPFTLLLKLDTFTLTFCFLAPFAFLEAYFHKMKGKEALRSHNDLNTTDNNMGAFPCQLSCIIWA